MTVAREVKSGVMSQSSGRIRCVAVGDELEYHRREKELLVIDVGRVVLWSGHSAQGFNPLAER